MTCDVSATVVLALHTWSFPACLVLCIAHLKRSCMACALPCPAWSEPDEPVVCRASTAQSSAKATTLQQITKCSAVGMASVSAGKRVLQRCATMVKLSRYCRQQLQLHKLSMALGQGAMSHLLLRRDKVLADLSYAPVQ